jgi:hypothetical protein
MNIPLQLNLRILNSFSAKIFFFLQSLTQIGQKELEKYKKGNWFNRGEVQSQQLGR